MKARYLIATAAIAATALAACSNEEVNALPDNNAIRVSTEVGSASSRAGMTTADLTSFGMFISPTDASNIYSYNNYNWVKSNGEWSSFKCTNVSGTYQTEASLMLWRNQTSEVQATAYAPYQKSLGDTSLNGGASIDVSVADQTDLKAIDYLYAQSTVVPSGTQDTNNDIYYDTDLKALHVKLHHRLAKFVITLTLGTEFNDANNGNATVSNPVTEIKVFGSYTGATYYLANNSLDITKTSPTEMTVKNLDSYVKGVGKTSTDSPLTPATATYECYVLPQIITTNGLKVQITVNGKQYLWTYTDNNYIIFEEGKAYSLPLTVGNDMVTAGAWSVTDWTTAADSDIETD